VANRSLKLTDKLYEYLLDVSLREDKILRRLRGETRKLPFGAMQIGPDQGQFMSLLVKLIGAVKAIEIGTFTGYSSISVARALPARGRLICCDVSEEFTKIARKYWKLAGVDRKITLKLAPATRTLDGLVKAGHSGSFDFAFIDADKANYGKYYERCLKLLRPGGLVAVDNVLWNGAVIDSRKQDVDTKAIRAFNARLKRDKRVEIAMLPIGDGLTLARKR
jgi:predicted O-methyltransferase YrrM